MKTIHDLTDENLIEIHKLCTNGMSLPSVERKEDRIVTRANDRVMWLMNDFDTRVMWRRKGEWVTASPANQRKVQARLKELIG